MTLKIRKKIPIEDEYRTVTRFAIIPIWVENKLIWLQKYYSLQKYGELYYSTGSLYCSSVYKWVTTKRFLSKNIQTKY